MSDHYTVLGLYRKVAIKTKTVDRVVEEFDLKDGEIESLTSAAYPDGAIVDDKTLHHEVYKQQYLFPFLLGICGFFLGIALAGGTGYIMNMDVGGKPPFSYMPTGVITYETTLACAVVGSLLSIFYFGKLPNWTERAYDPDISDGALGLLVKLDSTEDQDRAAAMMEEMGAYRVHKGKNNF